MGWKLHVAVAATILVDLAIPTEGFLARWVLWLMFCSQVAIAAYRWRFEPRLRSLKEETRG